MKTRFVLGTGAALCLACGAFSAFGDVVVSAENAEVAISAAASPVVRFAADEMTNFLSRAFGRAVPLVNAPTAGRATILLGELAAERAKLDVAAMARDEFALRVTADGAIALAGRDDPKRNIRREVELGTPLRFERGTLFGVYAFLEKFVGCRFYFPGELGECVPHVESFSVPASWGDKPTFTVRRWYEGPKCTWFEGGKDEPQLRLHWIQAWEFLLP